MQNYHDLLEDTLENGQHKPNRTGVGTTAVVGRTIVYDLREGFPAITTKKLAFKTAIAELVGFWRGFRSAAQFRALGCGIWDQNANETPAWVDSKYREGVDDLGRLYGVQWTDWKDWREAHTNEEFAELASQGYELVASDTSRGVRIMRKGINQLEEALRTLLTNPYDRGIAVTAWRPDEFDRMALRPCHSTYRFIALPDGTLHGTLDLRSNDLFLGHPFNVASFGVFLSVMARLSGLQAATITIFITDAHIYDNHVDQVREQLSRSHYPAPRLVLSDRIRKIENLDDIKGAFERIEPSDFSLEGYQSHAPLKAPMAA